uniref:Photosystem II protein I n=1 Tax=Alisma plantago-aquatica TaxID=15000 RepID=A0A513U1P4_ALIPL|nr:photosystem II protein I [Alisma plantago-aquatica]QDG01545.1 photosystem II protein I [Alisma plantago-aquatica]WNS59277.1 photosystem II protein I [Alisma plantago-aquatica subsp. orientale]WPM91539.1 photosystem II protein I [Alisma plantago-aquatica subsp. orientale]
MCVNSFISLPKWDIFPFFNIFNIKIYINIEI